MAKSGQQHSKADVGGQRPAKDDKKAKAAEKSETAKGITGGAKGVTPGPGKKG